MTRRHTFPEIMLQLALAAIACMLFNIPDQAKEGIPMTMYILIFAYALISYLCDRLFFHSSKSLPAAGAFHLLQVVAGMAAACLFHQITGVASGVFLGIVFVVLSLMAFRETTRGININMLTLCFDALVVLLFLYVLFVELGSGKLAASLPGVVGTAAAFAGIMVLRDGRRISGRDRLFSILIIVAIVVVAFLIYLAAGDPLREGMTGMFAGIGAALAWIGKILKEILMFLSRLFPEPQYENVDGDFGSGISMPGGEMEEEVPLSPVPLMILGGILLIAAVVVIIIVFRKRRFSGTRIASVQKETKKKKNRVSLWTALRIWAEDKLYHIRVRLFFLKNRSTPVGRFYRLVRSLKRSGHALKTGETPKEFLQRYIASLQPDDKRIPELKSLIDDLNLQLYRG